MSLRERFNSIRELSISTESSLNIPVSVNLAFHKSELSFLIRELFNLIIELSNSFKDKLN